jgi:hypothetical protein
MSSILPTVLQSYCFPERNSNSITKRANKFFWLEPINVTVKQAFFFLVFLPNWRTFIHTYSPATSQPEIHNVSEGYWGISSGSEKLEAKTWIEDSGTNTDFSVTYHYPLHRIPASIKARSSDFISLRPFFFLTELSWHLHLGRSGEGVVGVGKWNDIKRANEQICAGRVWNHKVLYFQITA